MISKEKILLLVAIAIVYFVFDTLLQAGFFYQTESIGNRNVEIITGIYGPEDMEWDADSEILIVSSTNRRSLNKGEYDSKDGIYFINVEDNSFMKCVTDYASEFHPHGISLFSQDSLKYLYVVNHSENDNSVELFQIQGSFLKHLKTYTDPLMSSPNDVVGDEVGKFYVSNDHGNKSSKGKIVENYLRMPYSYILYYDGDRFKKALQGLVYANGVQLSNSGNELYVTHTIGHEFIELERDRKTGNLKELKRKDLSMGLDNISVDKNGTIWIAGHPKMLKFGGHAIDAANFSASQVIKIEKEKSSYKVTKVYENDGEQFSGASIAVNSGNYLFVGGVFDDKILKMPISN